VEDESPAPGDFLPDSPSPQQSPAFNGRNGFHESPVEVPVVATKQAARYMSPPEQASAYKV